MQPSSPVKRKVVCSIACFVGLMTTACATVNITSRPAGAEVILAIPGQESGKILGKTPFSSSVSEIAKATNKATLVVTLKRPGYRAQSFIIPNLGSGKLEIDASLQAVGADDSQDINLAIRYILEAEKEIIEKDFKAALKSLEKAKGANPNLAAIYMFEGIIYNLQSDKNKASDALMKALALDPTDTEIKTLLSEITGGTPPPTARKRGK